MIWYDVMWYDVTSFLTSTKLYLKASGFILGCSKSFELLFWQSFVKNEKKKIFACFKASWTVRKSERKLKQKTRSEAENPTRAKQIGADQDRKVVELVMMWWCWCWRFSLTLQRVRWESEFRSHSAAPGVWHTAAKELITHIHTQALDAHTEIHRLQKIKSYFMG